MEPRIIAVVAALAALSACDNKPKHYLVLCENTDSSGWKLIDFIKRDGCLVSCTYQSPDSLDLYTTRCDDKGCGIK